MTGAVRRTHCHRSEMRDAAKKGRKPSVCQSFERRTPAKKNEAQPSATCLFDFLGAAQGCSKPRISIAFSELV
ncbi:MAG: hypothetical protein WBE38_20330 [Terracidiphilus sp.]|jgi:hypothetical protein